MGEDTEEPPDEAGYATRIEEAFITERGTPFLLSAKDWQLIRGWRESGIPVETAIRAIRETFERRRERGMVGKISSISYCALAVEERWQMEKRGLVGQGQGRRDEKPAEIAPRLARLVHTLLEAGNVVPGDLDRDLLQKAVGKAVAKIEALAPDGGFDEIEEKLSAIEAGLIRSLRKGLSAEVSSEVEAGVALSLGETAGLATEVVDRMRRALTRREVRHRLGLPPITLFGG